MDSWSNLCTAVTSQSFKNESDLESFFKRCLIDVFGWDKDEIDQQKIVRYGHALKRLDLALVFKGHHSLVFELKAPNIRLTSGDSAEQISSYMLQTRAKFGLLANDRDLQLFYITTNDYEQPKRILDLEFDDESEDGRRLGILLKREGYNESRLKNFCEEKLHAQRIKDLKCLLTSGSGKDTLLKALADSDNPFANEAWREALNKISILSAGVDSEANAISDNDSEELIILLSEDWRRVVFEALSKTHADGEYYTDEIRQEALSGLKIVKWSAIAPAVRTHNTIRGGYTKRIAKLDIDTESLGAIDKKIKGLVTTYIDWVANDRESLDFIATCERDTEWANKNILNPELLEKIPADKFESWLSNEAMPNMARWRDGMVYRHAYKLFKPGNDIETNKLKLIDNINFIRNTPAEKRFEIVEELLDQKGDRYMRGWGPEAWLSLASYQFPNQIPRLNDETRSFFDCIGINLGKTTSKTINQQLEFIYDCFCRWGNMGGNNRLTLFQLDNLIAFAMRKAVGQRYLNEHFGANLEVKTKIDRKVIP